MLVEKEYRLANDIAPASCIIKTGGDGKLLVYDEKKKYNRAIRHCRNEKSIFLDEQSEFAVLDPIVIIKGNLRVGPNEITTKLFLDASPQNVKNGGSLFEEINDEMEASKSLEVEDLIVDLKSLVKETQKKKDGLLELQTLVSSIKKSYVVASKLSMPELRREVYRAIDSNPLAFVDEKGNPQLFSEKVKREYLALRSIAEGVVKVTVDGRSIVWGDTGALICSIPVGLKATEYFAEFLETDDGMILIDKIMDSI